MVRMSVGQFKTNFSEVLDMVKAGEEVEVLYGRGKEPIAKLIPIKQNSKNDLLGALEGKATYTISDDWKMTPEEILKL